MFSSNDSLFDNIENDNSEEYNEVSYKPKRERKQKKEHRKSINRKIVNMPAEPPYIRIIDGEERLCFKYNTKISESAMNTMPRQELEENEFCVRFDLESVDITKLNDKFKTDNCVYPRAICEKEDYKGNRWDYETDCNRYAWQFVSLNPVLLYGKKGLIQRAVDSYRSIAKEHSRIIKSDKIVNGVLRRRFSDLAPRTVSIFWNSRGCIRKSRVRVDIENVNYDKIEDEFKSLYTVFCDEYDENSFGLNRFESTNEDNIIAVKIAYLNVDNTPFWNAVKATDLVEMLRKAVDAYKETEEYESEEIDDGSIDYGKIVSKTLENVFDDENDDNIFFSEDTKE
ncbi:hypothetical protein GVAV_000824 [Gurleya vavrai]